MKTKNLHELVGLAHEFLRTQSPEVMRRIEKLCGVPQEEVGRVQMQFDFDRQLNRYDHSQQRRKPSARNRKANPVKRLWRKVVGPGQSNWMREWEQSHG